MHSRIRDVRKARGLTLAQVAARCTPPTTAQTIGRLETGMRTVSMGWLRRIAEALDVPSTDLVTLPERADVPLAALLGADGPVALSAPQTVIAPTPGPAMVGLRVEVSQGDLRAGDTVWLEKLTPDRYAGALNRDVLAPRPVGRFVYGRLADVGPGRVVLLPPTPGARQQVLADVAWLAVARLILRPL